MFLPKNNNLNFATFAYAIYLPENRKTQKQNDNRFVVCIGQIGFKISFAIGLCPDNFGK